MQSVLTESLNWTPPLRRLYGRAWRERGIEIYADFSWETLVGHNQLTFTNYLSLANYLRRYLTGDKRRALILTQQDSRPEGRHSEHPEYEIFVVNIRRYREVAKNDAAGAYFAGLQGAPIIRASDLMARQFTRDEVASLLDALSTAESVADWIRRHPTETAALGAIWDEILASCASTPRLAEELGSRIRQMSGENIPQLTALIGAVDFPANILRAASLARRKESVDEFRAELTAERWREKDWQSFFEREDWIFGHGLLYQFVHVLQRETLVGGKEMSNRGGQVADFSIRTIGTNLSFIALVDIKTPAAKLVSVQQCRNGAHPIDSDLAEAVAQILANCDEWTREGSGQTDNVRRAEREGWRTAQPRGILVLGNSRSLSNDDAIQSFELFRRHLHGVEILTFDELLLRADALASPRQSPGPATPSISNTPSNLGPTSHQ